MLYPQKHIWGRYGYCSFCTNQKKLEREKTSKILIFLLLPCLVLDNKKNLLVKTLNKSYHPIFITFSSISPSTPHLFQCQTKTFLICVIVFTFSVFIACSQILHFQFPHPLLYYQYVQVFNSKLFTITVISTHFYQPHYYL